MKTARDIAHELANRLDASCSLHEELGWSHGPRCEWIKEAIEAACLARAEWMREQAALQLADYRLRHRQNEYDAADVRALPLEPKS